MPGKIALRFYEELNDFLPKDRKKVAFQLEHKQTRSVKDLIESLGIPHTEVDLIIVNGESVGFDRLIKDGDYISVYPMFETLDISPINHLRPTPLRNTKFVLDCHLGRLASYLRMLGFDSLYRNDYEDKTLASISIEERRILLTRDKGLLMRKEVTHGYFVRSRDPRNQLLEVIKRFDLIDSIQAFTRCSECNGQVTPVNKSLVDSLLLPRTKKDYNQFWQCTDCKNIYWKGSHYDRMQKLIEDLISKVASE